MQASVLQLTLSWVLTLTTVNADMYLHNPRGSNNRLDEAGRARNNPNRLFDSQNNNRGGYNVGSLYYYEGSVLSIEWTNQHSCADPNSHCEVILQYMCGDLVRDGTTTQTIPSNPLLCQDYNCNTDPRYGMHEDYQYYQNCMYRKRNYGLFTADQNLKGTSAKYTRQNPQGTRRGYECPEERDHYPYWHPTPWKDIAVLTNDATRCRMYQKESENVKGRWSCVLPESYLKAKGYKNYIIPSTEEECKAFRYPDKDPEGAQAEWKETPAHGLPKPECRETEWSRDNHLGNSLGGYPLMYNWTIPDLNSENCALRIRYNISTGEFDGWDSAVNATLNGKKVSDLDVGSRYGLSSEDAEKRGYVYKQNPQVALFSEFADKFKLQLAINTNQIGRVFQDRSHTFAVRKRGGDLAGKKIQNVNVRGKRGNIVQVYPAVEYDFVPNTLLMKNGHYVHFQWTGSNTNPNNNDGQGKAGTDRSNVILLKETKEQSAKNYGHWTNSHPKQLEDAKFLGFSEGDLRSLALLDKTQFRGEMSELDDAGTYYDLGPRKVTGKGTYHYMCTRNNNFSNRSQKGRIIVGNTDLITKKLGSNGGDIAFGEDESIAVEAGTFSQLQEIQVEVLPADEGETFVESQGGKVGVGDDYASNFVVIRPEEMPAKDGKKLKIKMKVDDGAKTSTIELFRGSPSENLVTWYKVEAEINEGYATFETEKGGVYVARTMPNTAAIAGIVVACIVVVVAIVGTVFYCRKHPGKFNSCVGNARRSVQRQI